jgi:pimeloyl-ACP methyl ester carboxylesterase
LEHNRIQSIGLVSHSVGGAVVIKAAAALPGIIRTVVTLSTQSYGAIESVSQLEKGCSIILIHGTDDDCRQSVHLMSIIKQPILST